MGGERLRSGGGGGGGGDGGGGDGVNPGCLDEEKES